MNLRITGNRNITAWIFSMILVLFATQGIVAEGQVTLTLTSYADSYVLHEPLELRGELVNDSDQTIRIYGMEQFSDENMPCLFLEITTPDGRQQQRRTCFSLVSVVKSATYLGDPLGPGERFGFKIYPSETYFIDNLNEGGWTFPVAGEYRVRLVYEVEEFRERLWKPVANRLYSNQIKLRITIPSSAEKEILDSYWKHVVPYGEAWDGKRMWGFDIPELKRVLEKYSNEPMIKYIHFALLNEASGAVGADLPNAKTHAELLMSRFPDFRSGLVRSAYGTALIASERKAEGLKMWEDALRVDPLLENNVQFMQLKIGTEKGSDKAFWRWLYRRKDRNGTQGNFRIFCIVR